MSEEGTAKIEFFTDQIKTNPSDPLPYVERARIYHSLNKFLEALNDANKLLSLQPNLPEGHYIKGKILVDLKDFVSAVACFIESLLLGYDAATIKRELLNLHATEGFQNYFLSLELTNIFTSENNWKEAEKYANEAKALAEANDLPLNLVAKATTQLVAIYQQLGKQNEAAVLSEELGKKQEAKKIESSESEASLPSNEQTNALFIYRNQAANTESGGIVLLLNGDSISLEDQLVCAFNAYKQALKQFAISKFFIDVPEKTGVSAFHLQFFARGYQLFVEEDPGFSLRFMATEITKENLAKNDIFAVVTFKETEFKNEFEHAEQLNVPFHPAIPLSLDCATSSWEGIVLGGTFDHLHSGHHLMLSIAAQGARQRVRVGVTDLSMLKTKKFIGQLQSLAQRVNNVRDFLSSVCAPSVELDIFPIADPYGPTLDATNVQAIVVSDETVEFTRNDINKKRSEKGIPILEIVCVPLLDPPTLVIHGAKGKLSSTQLRNLQVERTLIRLLNI